MFNKEKSCYGCPDRTAECHGNCLGYQNRYNANRDENKKSYDSYYRYNGVDVYNKRRTRQQKGGWHRKYMTD